MIQSHFDMMHVTQTDQAIVGDCDDPLSVPASSDLNGGACKENEIDYTGLQFADT